MATRIQIRRDTEEDWEANNPTLSLGELGYVTSTGELVVGDGSTPFVDLPRIAHPDNFVLTSPDGTRWQLGVDNSGNLTTTSV